MISATAVTISCVVTGVTQAVTTVWKKGDQADLSGVTGYTVVQGDFDSSGGTQTTTLALTGDVNNADSVYTCDVTPQGGSPSSTDVTLNVYRKFNFLMSKCSRCSTLDKNNLVSHTKICIISLSH